jgi:hypothetical protein
MRLKPTLKVVKCCDDNESYFYEVDNQGGIQFAHIYEADYDLGNVRFCLWCGKRLEVYAEDPSAKMQAFEDLKKQMQRDEALRYAKLSPADKAKYDLKVEMNRDNIKKSRKGKN